MFLGSFAVILLSLVDATSAQQKTVKDFEPITEPGAGDTVSVGSNFTIKWDAGAAYYPGHMRISLVRGNSLDELAMPITIAESVATDEASYEWQVSGTLGVDDSYWIMVTYLMDQDIVNYSSKFSISTKSSGSSSGSGPLSPSATGIATSPETSTLTSTSTSQITAFTTGTTTASTTSISTTTQPGAAEHAAPTACALLAVAAIGMFAF